MRDMQESIATQATTDTIVAEQIVAFFASVSGDLHPALRTYMFQRPGRPWPTNMTMHIDARINMGLIVLDVFRRDEFSTDLAYKRWLVADIRLSDVMHCEIF